MLRWSVPSLVLVSALGCSCAARDVENVCNAAERSGAAEISDPAERARRIAEWTDRHVRSDRVRRALAESASLRPEDRGRYLRELGRESGYDGPCPMADELERSAREVAPSLPPPTEQSAAGPEDPAAAHRLKMSSIYPLVGEGGRANEIRASKTPVREASEELTAHGPELYGRPIPVYLGYSNDASALEEPLAEVGCSGAQKGLRPLDPEARHLLEKCVPIGPALLAKHRVDDRASVGRATLALLLESSASPEMAKSPVHLALVSALLGPARVE